MHHAPRATRQLRFDATEWESPTIAQVAVYYSAFLCGNCGICGKCGKQFVGRALQSCFFLSWALKYPARQQSPSSYVSESKST